MDKIVAGEMEKYLIYLKTDVLVNHQDSVILDRYIRLMHDEATEAPKSGERRTEERDPGEHEQYIAESEGLVEAPVRTGLFSKKKI